MENAAVNEIIRLVGTIDRKDLSGLVNALNVIREALHEAPKILEDAQWAPSWRRMCKVLLRNDHWCKGLGLTQPKSEAYGKYLEMKRARPS